MVKRIPGWANFLLLWAAYFTAGWILKFLTNWTVDIRFIAFFSAFYCGAYLAKWRFHDGGWHFN